MAVRMESAVGLPYVASIWGRLEVPLVDVMILVLLLRLSPNGLPRRRNSVRKKRTSSW